MNDSTALETPRLREFQRREAERRNLRQYLIPAQKGQVPASVWKGRKHRAQYIKTYLTLEAREAKG